MLKLIRWMVQAEWPMRLLDPLVGGRFNLFDPSRRRDPYPKFHALRASAPVYHHPVFRVWYLSRHADCVALLRDPRFSVDRSQIRGGLPGMDPTRSLSPDFVEAIVGSLLMLDPPDHTRVRNLVSKAFTARAVESVRPRIREIAEELLDRVASAGEMDLVRDYAMPLPVVVIAELLGVPPEDRELFKSWSDDIAALIDPISSPRGLQGAQAAFLELAAYFHQLFEDRRRSPRDDLVSALVAAEEQGDQLSEAELLSVCGLILGAGHETTTNLIGNSVLCLLRHPDERKRLQDDPSLVKSAVEEFLRYESPVQLTDRVAAEDLELDGHRVRRGELVVALVGAANRDPARFPEPDRLDLGRADNGHLAFGHGVHFCLGAQLARVEGQIAIDTLLRRFPDLHGDPEPPAWVPSILLRGPASLPLALRSPGAKQRREPARSAAAS